MLISSQLLYRVQGRAQDGSSRLVFMSASCQARPFSASACGPRSSVDLVCRGCGFVRLPVWTCAEVIPENTDPVLRRSRECRRRVLSRLSLEFGVLLWFDTQRRPCRLPGSRTTSCPSAPLETGQGDTGHTHLRSIRPLLPVRRRDRSHWSFPIAPRTSDRKSHLWHLESCLCASLCGCSCARLPRMRMLLH